MTKKEKRYVLSGECKAFKGFYIVPKKKKSLTKRKKYGIIRKEKLSF